jgi:putative flavoprotein involved in K+ transport
MDEQFDVVVIGGGQAGLATGYYLAKHGVQFTILEAHDRLGESWRRRWDTLRLFTAARYSGLPGMPFPAPPHYCPTKDEVADYIETYARRMDLPVQLGKRVERLTGAGNGVGFTVHTGGRLLTATQVVVASGAWHEPFVPEFAAQLQPDIRQLHSSEFQSASQLQPGAVLVVGAANSGAEIAHTAARSHETWLVGRDTGQMPFDINGRIARLVDPGFWFMANHLLTVANPIGRRARPSLQRMGSPLERVRKGDLAAAGVKRVVARVTDVREGLPVLDDGQTFDVANVVWATGFRHEYPWIQLERKVIGDDGWPLHERGVSTVVPGLYFVGVPFQYSLASPLIGGVSRDARYVAERLSALALRPDARPTAKLRRSEC